MILAKILGTPATLLTPIMVPGVSLGAREEVSQVFQEWFTDLGLAPRTVLTDLD